MARIDRDRARSAEIDVAEPQHHVTGVEDDIADLVAAFEAVDALDEVDVVRQPRRVAAHRLAITCDGIERRGILKRHRQIKDAGRHLHAFDRRQPFFGRKQRIEQGALVDCAAVVVDLKRTHARRQFQNAGDRVGFELLHQRVNAEAIAQVQFVGTVLQQDVAVAGLTIGHRRAVAFRRQGRDHRCGNRIGRRQQRLDDRRRGHHRREVGDREVLRLFARERIVEGDRSKADAVARLCLTDFPQFGLGDGDGTDEAAETRTVAGQDHRHVTGEIHRTDGVFAIVDVRWVQSGLAAVAAGPGRFWAEQADAEPVRIVVHLPVGGEERLDRLGREEIRCSVRAVKHADIPGIGIGRDQRGGRRAAVRGIFGTRAERQQVADAQRAAGMAAELAEHEGRAAAQIKRHVEAALHGDVGAAAGCGATDRQRLPGPHLNWRPPCHGLAVEGRLGVGASECDHGVGMEFQRRTRQRAFDAGGAIVVADDAIGEAERIVVHGARRRHADVPVTDAAGIVLDRGVGAGQHHLDRVGTECEARQRAG